MLQWSNYLLISIFLIAVTLAAPLRWAISRTSIWNGWYVTAALTLTMLVLLPVYSERAF